MMRTGIGVSWLGGAFAALLAVTPALAQMQLPGAVANPTPAGAAAGPAGGPAGAKPATPKKRAPAANPADPGKAVSVRAPSERTILDKTLQYNGRVGALRFERRDGKIVLTQMKLAGDQISRHGDSCEINVTGGPFAVEPDGRNEGLLRYKVAQETCPFTIDVLDGAVIVSYGGASSSSLAGPGVCEFKQADCRGFLAGVWGPSGASFKPDEMRAIERDRGAAERNARANFRAKLRAAQGDREKVRQVAAEQAGFSAAREERCRDYYREDKHGFCASRITAARAVSLAAQMGNVAVDDGTAKPVVDQPRPKPRPRPRPVATAPPTSAPFTPGPAPRTTGGLQ